MSDMGLGLEFEFCRSIASSSINTPAVGQTTFYLGDTSFLEIGDEITVNCDGGSPGSATIVDVVKSQGECGVSGQSYIVVDVAFDLSSETGCTVCVDDLDLSVIVDRLKEHGFSPAVFSRPLVTCDLGFIFTCDGIQVTMGCC